ncbi:hypothetical protein [Streptomyces sp. NPDC050982]|uniref:hypothetical protein n=1 Tax=Streptomyces sp. NPDC050982 TaxID=3154746 RepID=UPI0033F7EA96
MANTVPPRALRPVGLCADPCIPEARPKEPHLSNGMLRSLHFTAPILFTLGALNAFTAQQRQDHAPLATALCLCICVAGLLAGDLLQHAFRRDRVVLAHVAVHPGAAARHIARALGARE